MSQYTNARNQAFSCRIQRLSQIIKLVSHDSQPEEIPCFRYVFAENIKSLLLIDHKGMWENEPV